MMQNTSVREDVLGVFSSTICYLGKTDLLKKLTVPELRT